MIAKYSKLTFLHIDPLAVRRVEEKDLLSGPICENGVRKKTEESKCQKIPTGSGAKRLTGNASSQALGHWTMGPGRRRAENGGSTAGRKEGPRVAPAEVAGARGLENVPGPSVARAQRADAAQERKFCAVPRSCENSIQKNEKSKRNANLRRDLPAIYSATETLSKTYYVWKQVLKNRRGMENQQKASPCEACWEI